MANEEAMTNLERIVLDTFEVDLDGREPVAVYMTWQADLLDSDIVQALTKRFGGDYRVGEWGTLCDPESPDNGLWCADIISAPEGNVYVLIGHVREALIQAGAAREEVEAFTADASSGDYQHALAVCRRWVDFDREPKEEDESC